MLIFMIVTFIILLYVILYSNLKIRLSLSRYDGSNNIIFSLTGLYGMLKHTRKISTTAPIRKHKDVSTSNNNTGTSDRTNKPVNEDSIVDNTYDIVKMIDNYRKFYIKYEPYIKKIKEKSVSNGISWHTRVGTNDAAETAIIAGTVWIIKTFSILFAAENYNFSNILINVVPIYNTNVFETTIDCIFNIKLGYIINANIKRLLVQIKDGVKR